MNLLLYQLNFKLIKNKDYNNNIKEIFNGNKANK